MAVNIFGSGNNDFYDIVRDLDLNSNAIPNVKDPEMTLTLPIRDTLILRVVLAMAGHWKEMQYNLMEKLGH